MSAKRSFSVRMYGWLFELLTPVWTWWLNRRLKRGKETGLSIEQRWVRQPSQRPPGILVWGHAVGVGEALALAGLLKRLHVLVPDLHFLISTSARTSSEVLARQALDTAFVHTFSPVDTPSNAAKFMDHWKPDLAIWCEMDLWPALISETAHRRIPHILVNARLSTRSYLKRRLARVLYQPLLTGFDRIWAQNSESAECLVNLGARPEQIQINGNIKAMALPLHVDADELQQWRQALGMRRVWLLASSHAGEEALAIEAHRLIQIKYPNALLIIAPRDPKRGPEISNVCGPDTPLRSRGDIRPTASIHYVADSMGELGLWYRLCKIAMVGGSWVPVGGHNPYEAVALHGLVVHGPYVHNFRESYADLDATGQSLLATNADQIAGLVMQAWSDSLAQVTQVEQAITHDSERLRELLELLPSRQA